MTNINLVSKSCGAHLIDVNIDVQAIALTVRYPSKYFFTLMNQWKTANTC